MVLLEFLAMGTILWQVTRPGTKIQHKVSTTSQDIALISSDNSLPTKIKN